MKQIKRVLFSTVALLLMSTGMAIAEPGEGESVLSLRGGMVQFGGELELEYVKSEKNDDPGNNSDARMKLDKVVLTTKVKFADQITFQSDIESVPDKSIKVDEAWVKFGGLPYDTWVKVGLEDMFMKPHRKTESHPILGHAFWQDEDLGVYIGGDHGIIYWRASATNGRRLKDRKIQEDDVFPITTDDDDNVEKNSNKQVGAGLGVNVPVGENHHIDILPFYYTATLSDDDVTYLQGISTYEGDIDDDDQDRFGVNVELVAGNGTIFGQYMMGTDGDMERKGWYSQLSYKVDLPEGNIIKSVEPLFRYEDYKVDLTADPTDSRTWDRQTTTLAVIIEIVKNLNFKAEYYMNDEDTGNGDVDNDEFLAQLEAKF